MQIDKFTRNAIFSKNIWKLSGHADFLNFFITQPLWNFDPGLGAGSV